MQSSHHTTSDDAYRRALTRLRPAIGGALGFSAVVNVLMLTGSIYMLQIYDRVLSSGSIPTLLGLFAIVVVLYGFLGFYDFLRARLLSRAAARLDDGVGAAAFDHWLHSGLTESATASTPAGRAGGTTVLRDLETVRGFIAGPALTALVDVPFVPLFLGVLFMIHPWLGLLTMAGAAIGGLFALANRALSRSAIDRGAMLDAADRDFADRGRRNSEAIVAMGMQTAIKRHWQSLHRIALANGQAAGDPSEVMVAASRAFRMLLQSAILTLGALLVLRGEISPGMIIAGSILSGRALAPVDQLIGQWRTVGRAAGAHARLKALFATDTAAAACVDLPSPTGQISVTGLTKLTPARPGSDPARILSNVSFSLDAGDGLGVIGASACGKSTLARVLVGGAVADAGDIRLDGATRDQWDPVRLGRHVGYLPQLVEMLPGTVRDNIARFDRETSDETVIAAARLTGVHDMILALPDGYSTRLGGPDSAHLLSGGQMQRLGLARAVCGMPALVVLDEPNSNLDVAGDDALTRTIAALRAEGSTVIVMAHRPSALAAVNKLMLMETGVVRAFGDKEEILSESFRVGPPPAANTPAATSRSAPRPVPGSKPAADLHVVSRDKAAGSPSPNTPETVRRAGPAHRRRQA